MQCWEARPRSFLAWPDPENSCSIAASRQQLFRSEAIRGTHARKRHVEKGLRSAVGARGGDLFQRGTVCDVPSRDRSIPNSRSSGHPVAPQEQALHPGRLLGT